MRENPTKYKHPSSIVVRRILTHVCTQDDVYHILRYYHADGSEEPGDMKSDDGKKIIFKKKYSSLSGYVFSVTNCQIFNTQDQGTVKFQENSGTYKISHSGKSYGACSNFVDSDFIE